MWAARNLGRCSLTLLVAIGLTACGNTATPTKQLTSSSPNGRVTATQYSDASWAVHYSSLPELVAHTDLVVLGVAGKSQSYVHPDGYEMSNVDVTVGKILYSRAGEILPAIGSNVIVAQTGGVSNGVLSEIRDDPIFGNGERVLLFLTHLEDARYKVTGGPSGRFTVDTSGRNQAFSTLSASIPNSLDSLSAALKKTALQH